MNKIIRNKGETRKDYLYRVALEYIKQEIEMGNEGDIVYDDAECGGSCLTEDMKMELIN